MSHLNGYQSYTKRICTYPVLMFVSDPKFCESKFINLRDKFQGTRINFESLKYLKLCISQNKPHKAHVDKNACKISACVLKNILDAANIFKKKRAVLHFNYIFINCSNLKIFTTLTIQNNCSQNV